MTIALQLVAAYLFADLVTGIIHWWEDTYCHPGSHVLVRNLICDDNQLHHKSPQHFTKGSYWDRTALSIIAAAAFYLAWRFIFGHSWLIAAFALFASQSNQIHYWAHIRNNNLLITALQTIGLLSSRRQHGIHHRFQDCNYCVMSDWLNPALEWARLWRRIEALLCRLGIPVRRIIIRPYAKV